MAITSIIEATGNAALTEFTTTERGFWLHGDNFNADEKAVLERIGPSGSYQPATNQDGVIFVSAMPNSVYVDLPAGTYRIAKPVTGGSASVGYEEPA